MAEKSKVAVIFTDSYDEELVYSSVKAGIESLGGIGRFVSPSEKIHVKPNFLAPSDADSSVVTHPSVIKAVLRILQEGGCTKVSYGDSPMVSSSSAAAARIGLNDENTFGAVPADMSSAVHVSFPEGIAAKDFMFAKGIAEADAVICVCKMKTHALEVITGAVKNVYGFIYGANKAKGHMKFPNASVFARMLADIHRCIKPRLHIMDGITAMEGNGPASGSPIKMNMILVSSDPVAIDSVFCTAIKLNPQKVPTNVQGQAMGIGRYEEAGVEILLIENGEVKETLTTSEFEARFGNGDFDVDRNVRKRSVLGRIDTLTGLLRRPYITESKCIKCGMCVNHCPVEGGAVTFAKGKDKPPVYDYKKCIRCYCCQEICPQHAISVKGL